MILLRLEYIFLKNVRRAPLSTLRTLRVFRLLYQHSRRRLGSPWVDPINAVKIYQACYGLPRCNLNLVRLFHFFLPLLVFGAFSSSLTHAVKNLQPPSHIGTILPNPRVKCGGAPVPRDANHPTIICQTVRPFFPVSPRPTFSHVLRPSRHDPPG